MTGANNFRYGKCSIQDTSKVYQNYSPICPQYHANSFYPRNSTYYPTYIKINLDPGKYIFEAYGSQ